MYWTYILYSQILNKYYVGSTSDLKQRLSDHNTGRSHYTARGKPWELVYSTEITTNTEALQLENRIKRKGAGRYLKDNGIT